jgi:hypothetical protein
VLVQNKLNETYVGVKSYMLKADVQIHNVCS